MRPVHITAIGLVFLYCLAFLTGVIFTMTGFVQSDTCWLLKLGQVILKAHSIPASDPFSFTLPLMVKAGEAQPFVVYQWLSEIIFAWSFAALNLPGLIYVSTAITATASISLLFRLCLQKSGKLFLSFAIVALATATVALRLMARPEIFTLLFVVLWFWLLHRISGSENQEEAVNTRWWSVFGIVTTMIIWCNLHTGFVIGLLTLVIYALVSICQDKVAKIPFSPKSKALSASLLACSLATLINPAGVHLWEYLPRLFFAPVTLAIKEVQAISTRELLLPIYYPFFLLVGITIYNVVSVIRAKVKVPSDWIQLIGKGSNFTSIILILLAATVSLFCKRLACPMALILAIETSSLLGSSAPAQSTFTFFRHMMSLLVLEIPIFLLAVGGATAYMDKLVPLTLPQPSSSFQPSFQSIEFLWKNWHGGNVFNNAQIGSLLILYGPPELKVFVDTRLDAYGDKILSDYVDLIDARERGKDLLKAYDINWVVVTKRDRLGIVLRNVPGWQIVFEDSDAIIFRRAK